MNKISKAKIVFLGTGTPNPTPERSGPAVAIVIDNDAYLIDAGINIVRQAEMARRLHSIEALKACNLKKVFITHLHSDHTLGLADLILTPWILEREEPLNVFGPNGIKSMTDNLLKAYEVDIAGRLNGLEPINTTGYKVNAKEIEEEGLIYEDENVSVVAFRVNHMPFDAFGFKFITKEETIVISGDTAPNENLIKHAKDCDVLIHEVFSSTGVKDREMLWAIYHGSVHTSSIDLGKVCKSINPGKLILYHQLFMIDNYYDQNKEKLREEEMIKQIKQNYKGPVYSAKDLEIF